MNTNYPTHSKSGLIRSFSTVVIGILFLSFIGFDLRGEIQDFQSENEESINKVKEVFFSKILPTTKDSLDDVKQYAEENNITVENAQKTLELLKEYKDRIDFEKYGIEVPDLVKKTTE